MPSLTAALRDRLKADADVSALVAGRVYRIERPQASALPSITLQRISGLRSYTYGGSDASGRDRVQFDCWGRSYGEAEAIGDAAVAALEPAGVFGGIRFNGVFVETRQDLPPEAADGAGLIYRHTIDFIFLTYPA